ncbi:PREDICTED: uncharacterized protein LOC105970528 [Erythranthe guttata]|uniref:uncharacterized protein LOC105970528 n=1 Tax=Erythranthe guttata TaxID=4155 RepID=UPI00064DE84C|nr:PREDICTED: uncharacterized protein LOC105970528 [Erythranthe guttata]|eukprot:XP_012850817.1 PREDICTED: uncharacterized protein LOC105970528 [Erythranthe guttata]
MADPDEFYEGTEGDFDDEFTTDRDKAYNEYEDPNMCFDVPQDTPTTSEDQSQHFNVGVEFETGKELVEWAKKMGATHGYRLIVTSSKKNVKNSNDGLWRMNLKSGIHTHPILPYPTGQGPDSRLTPEEYEVVKLLRRSHVKPALIMDRLRKDNPQTSTSVKHVYNQLEKMKKENMAGKTVIQHVMSNLQDSGYEYWYRSNEGDDTLTDLMFAAPISLKLLRLFSHVILMDCTYKTNRYEMPLLEIIGITPVGKNFTIAVAFMSHEDANTYEWALRCLKCALGGLVPNVILTDRELGLIKAMPLIFPHSAHFLCLFHINRNVEKNASRFIGSTKHGLIFRRIQWAKLVESKTEEDYNDNYEDMVRRYGCYPKLISYLDDTWLIYKHKFVKAWTNKILHFGNTSTSRVESAHKSSKGWINASTGGVNTIQYQLDSGVEYQLTKIKGEFSKCSLIRLHSSSYPVFQGLICKVTHKALNLLDDELKKPGFEDPSLCDHVLWDTHALPCACRIALKIQQRDTFICMDLHPFWSTMHVEEPEIPEAQMDRETNMRDRIIRLATEVLEKDYMTQKMTADYMNSTIHPDTTHLAEPAYVIPKGRPKDKPTKRDKSGWEFPPFQRKPSTGEEKGKSSAGSKGRKNTSTGTPPSNVTDPGSGRGRGRGRGSGRSSDESTANQNRTPMPRKEPGDELNFRSYIPGFVAGSIVSYVNVVADGNCGYRCVAEAVFRDQNRWSRVRRDLIADMYEHFGTYASQNGQDEVIRWIEKCDWQEGPCSRDKWMSFPDMGMSIATKYNAALVLYAIGGNITYLPLVGPGELSHMIHMVLLGDHFVLIQLPVNCPLPPITPQWRHVRAANLAHLSEMFEERLYMWRRLSRLG